jgi:hypothetical protein
LNPYPKTRVVWIGACVCVCVCVACDAWCEYGHARMETQLRRGGVGIIGVKNILVQDITVIETVS